MLKTLCVWILFIMLLGSATVHASTFITEDLLDKRSLVKMVDKSLLVVSGSVIQTQGVWRSGIIGDGNIITTDVVIQVDSEIKGEPNYQDGACIRFMIIGGMAAHPQTGVLLQMNMSGRPKFKVGENVMVFLGKTPTRMFANYAHDGYYVRFGTYGKRKIKNDKVKFQYSKGGLSSILVEMPLDLAVNLGKASLIDKDATQLLEDQIKTLAVASSGDKVVVSESMVTSLTQGAKTILDTAEEE